MNKIKPDKQLKIDFIKSCIKIGEERGAVLSKVVKKWQTNVRTFDRLYKIAKEQHSEAQGRINTKLEAVSEQAAIDERKAAILSTFEKKKFLSEIVRAETNMIKVGNTGFPVIIRPDGTKRVIYLGDQLKALAELNHMDGDYAPTKNANTTIDGKDVEQSVFTDNQVDKILNELKNS